MKRFFLLTLGVLLSAGLGVQLSHLTFAVKSSEELIDELFADAHLDQTDTTDAKELNTLSKNDDVPFQNLYLFMFQNVTNGPSDAALAEIHDQLKEKKRRNYTEDELRSIVVEGSLEPIIEKWETVAGEIAADPTYFDEQDERLAAQDQEYSSFQDSNDFSDGISGFYDWYYQKYVRGQALNAADTLTSVPQQDVLDEYNYLVGIYQNELELQREYRKFSYESVADEMFFNNDLSDSANIDILHDLDLAHYVLFGSVIDYPDRSGSEPVLASEDELADLQLLKDSAEPEGSEDPDVTRDTVSPDDLVVTLSSDVVSPYTCFDDEALRDALNDYYASDLEVEGTLDDGEDSGVTYPALEAAAEEETSSGSSSSESGGGSGVTAESEDPAAAVDTALQNLDVFINQLQGTQGDWTRSLPCSEVFCITVELVSDTEDPVVSNGYGETSNCVLCHLAYINKRMGETLDKSLVASKPSQNWFEDATCKEAGSQISLDLNVYTIAMPIDLDPGDQTDDMASQNIEDLRNTLISLGEFAPSKSSYAKAVEDIECESLFNKYDAADTPITLDLVQEGCVEATENLQARTEEAVDKLLFEAKVGESSTLYEQASAEFSSMLLIFKNIQDGLKQSYAVDDAPLANLMSKDYCK